VDTSIRSHDSVPVHGGSVSSLLGPKAPSSDPIGSDFVPQLASTAGFDASTLTQVPVGDLRGADSPRLAGENADHVRTLVETGVKLPAILVHRPTMRVIDGMHRLRVALVRGQAEIEVRFFDGDEDAAFVLGVQSNVAHGLPLSLADRTAAASRIVRSHPQWSDRLIASSTGLSPKTVAGVRRRSTEDIPQLTSRVGRDGRTRAIVVQPPRDALKDRLDGIDAELRARARTREAAPTSVRSVDVAPPQPRPAPRENRASPDRSQILDVLRQDPSLRFTDSGRALLRLLGLNNSLPHQLDQLVENVPHHCADRVIDLATSYAEAWQEFADLLAQGKLAHGG
jgi:ParB-like chromosome segregation protein Spo0J